MTRCIQALFLAAFACLAACGAASSADDRARPEPGIYTSLAVNVGTQLGMGYNPTQGVTLQTLPQVSPSASPLGDLILKPDGRYEMPAMDYSGRWTFDPDQQSLTFTGGLAGVKNACHVSEGAYIVTFEFETSDGEPMRVAYRKAAERPIPDLAHPNGDFTGRLVVFDGDGSGVLDISSGKIIRRFQSASAGWPNAEGATVHVHDSDIHSPRNPINVELRGPDGRMRGQFSGSSPDGKPWTVEDYWFGELSPAGDRFVLFGSRTVYRSMNGGFYGDRPSDPVRVPTVSVLDSDGREHFFFESSGKFTPGWLDDGTLLFADETGGLSTLRMGDQTQRQILPGPIDDAAARPDGKAVLYRRGGRLEVFETDSGRSKTIQVGPESVDLSNLIILSMRWSADGQTLALATGGDPANAYHLVLVSPARGEARYVLSAQGDPVAVSSSLFGWTN